MRELDGIAKSKLRQVRGKLVRPRHRGPLDQHRYDGAIAIQRSRGFQSHEVERVVEPAASGLIAGIDPVLADQRKQNAA